MYRIAVIPGDGIGRTVVPEAVRVLESTGLKFDFQYMEVGYEVFRKVGASVPEEVLSRIKGTQACLFGATTTPVGVAGYRSAVVTLRRALDLYANVRPVKSYPIPHYLRTIECLTKIVLLVYKSLSRSVLEKKQGRMLMSEVLPPIAYQLGIGAFGGFFVGYIVKKILKIAIVVGVFVFALIYFAYRDVINVNYGKLIESISTYAGSAWEFLTPLLSNLPFIGSFILGIVLGLKAG